MRSELTMARESVFLQALEGGMSTAQIAEIARTSVQYVRRLIARARAEVAPEPAPPEDPPVLELVSHPLVKCMHPRASVMLGLHVLYCLDCDGVCADGEHWLPAQSASTPSVAVLAPRKSGCGARLQRLTAGVEQDPGGPTPYQPDPRGLKGGRQ